MLPWYGLPLLLLVVITGIVSTKDFAPAVVPDSLSLNAGDRRLAEQPRYEKLGPKLNAMIEEWNAAEERQSAQLAREILANAPYVQGDAVAVRILTSSRADGLRDFLNEGGGIIANDSGQVIEAYMPLSLGSAINARADVLSVGLIRPFTADVVSEGTTAHNSPDWNTAGFTGTGVKVGIIDVGFSGFASLQGTELPVSVTGGVG